MGQASREFPMQGGVLSWYVANITASLSSFLSPSFFPCCAENLNPANREETRALCPGVFSATRSSSCCSLPLESGGSRYQIITVRLQFGFPLLYQPFLEITKAKMESRWRLEFPRVPKGGSRTPFPPLTRMTLFLSVPSDNCSQCLGGTAYLLGALEQRVKGVCLLQTFGQPLPKRKIEKL